MIFDLKAYCLSPNFSLSMDMGEADTAASRTKASKHPDFNFSQ
jgi:hypothetical protein